MIVGPPTTVFSGPFAPSLTGPDPDGFNFVIPLSTPFAYDPARGNLLLDVSLTVASGFPALELSLLSTGTVPGDGSSRVYRVTPTAVPEPSAWLMLSLGLGLIALAGRR